MTEKERRGGTMSNTTRFMEDGYGQKEGDIIHCATVESGELCKGHFTCGPDGKPVESVCPVCGIVPNVDYVCFTTKQRFVGNLSNSGQLLLLMELCHDDEATPENTSNWPSHECMICTPTDGEERPHPMRLLTVITATELVTGVAVDEQGRSSDAVQGHA